MDEQAELRALLNTAEVPATVATRARIVLWHAEHRPKKDIAVLASASRPTVDLWINRYEREGLGGLLDRPRGAGREQVSPAVRSRIIADSRCSPPVQTGLSHWSSREMAAHIKRTEGVDVSHHYVAKLWRDEGLRPRGDPAPRPRRACGPGQPVHPQHPRCHDLADRESQRPLPFHSRRLLVNQSDRDVVRHHHPAIESAAAPSPPSSKQRREVKGAVRATRRVPAVDG